MPKPTTRQAWEAAMKLHGASGEHWAGRDFFAAPIPEMHFAAELLSLAADALLRGKPELARFALQKAELPALAVHGRWIMGKIDHEVIRWRFIEEDRKPPAVKMGSRNPTPATLQAMYVRDGWRCRFCTCRVVHPAARKRMIELLPGAIVWRNAYGDHPAFFVLSGVADHVVPHSRGGTSTLDNLVTCCAPCNYGKGDYLLEEVGIRDPRLRAPLAPDGWDGLERLLGVARTHVPSAGTG